MDSSLCAAKTDAGTSKTTRKKSSNECSDHPASTEKKPPFITSGSDPDTITRQSPDKYEIRIMQIFLSKHVDSLTGMPDNRCGYHIQHRKNGFFAKRNSRGHVPPDGHLRCILQCAQLAYRKIFIADIRVHWLELSDALYEAGIFTANQLVRKNGVEAIKSTYHARDIINLKTTFSL